MSDTLFDNFDFQVICSLSEVTKLVSKKNIPPYVNNLVMEVCCSDDQGEDVEVPYIRYRFR